MSGPVRFAPALALLLAAAGASAHAAALEPFTAEYQARYLGLQAAGSMTLATEGGNRWKYSLNIRNQLGDLSQSTVFEEHQGQLRPLSSSDRAVALMKKKSVDATYDWKAGQATWTGDVKPERRGPVRASTSSEVSRWITASKARDDAPSDVERHGSPGVRRPSVTPVSTGFGERAGRMRRACRRARRR